MVFYGKYSFQHVVILLTWWNIHLEDYYQISFYNCYQLYVTLIVNAFRTAITREIYLWIVLLFWSHYFCLWCNILSLNLLSIFQLSCTEARKQKETELAILFSSIKGWQGEVRSNICNLFYWFNRIIILTV